MKIKKECNSNYFSMWANPGLNNSEDDVAICNLSGNPIVFVFQIKKIYDIHTRLFIPVVYCMNSAGIMGWIFLTNLESF